MPLIRTTQVLTLHRLKVVKDWMTFVCFFNRFLILFLSVGACYLSLSAHLSVVTTALPDSDCGFYLFACFFLEYIAFQTQNMPHSMFTVHETFQNIACAGPEWAGGGGAGSHRKNAKI